MRQVQVRGCLPALLMLGVLGALVALVISASLAVALPVAVALLLAGLARSLWYRLTGRRPPPPFQGASFRTAQLESDWSQDRREAAGQDQGPIVDALPRKPGPPPDPGSTAT